MKRTLTTLGVSTALLCTLAFATTGQSPITQIKQVLSSASRTQDKSLTINKESLSLLKLQMPGKMKKAQANGKQSYVDLLTMEGQLGCTSNSIKYESNTNSWIMSFNENNLAYWGLLDNNKKPVWISKNDNVYSFTGKVQAKDDATVYACIFADQDGNLQIPLYQKLNLNKNNNYSCDFSVNGEITEGQPLYIGFYVEETFSNTTVSLSDMAFGYTTTAITEAEKWTAENNLPGLGITEGMADNAYTLLCEDSVTTLGLYLGSGNLSVVGMNTTATSVALPQAVSINGKKYQIEYFGRTDGTEMDWTGAQSVTSLDLTNVSNGNVNFANTKITDVFINEEFHGDFSGQENVYLHIPYGCSRSDYSWHGFKRVLIGNEQSAYPESAYDNAWVVPGEREGDYFSILYDQYESNSFCVMEIFTNEENITLPNTTDVNGNKMYITNIGSNNNNVNAKTLLGKAPNLKSLTVPEGYSNIYVNWDESPCTELHIMGAKPETQYALPSNFSVYIGAQEAYNDFKYDSNWNSAQLKPEGWELKKLETTCDNGLTTLEFDFYNNKLCVTNISSTADTVAIPDSVTLDGVQYKVETFGNPRMSGFNWSNAKSVHTLDLTYIKTASLYMEGSSVTDIIIGETNFENLNNVGNIYLHAPYGSSRNNSAWRDFKKVFIGEETPDYPTTSYNNAWVIAGEREGDYFSIVNSNGKFCVVEIFTEQDNVTLPETTPYTYGTTAPITSVGNSDNYNSSYNIFNKASNLKSLTVPACYDNIYLYWTRINCPLKELHMKGNMPQTNWNVPSSYNVYIGSQEAYAQYNASNAWKNAELIPEGWDFEWMAVNVQRKGEFAQTYIEMTDADWSLGVNVKVIGKLNATDLANIKKLTSLRKLDLTDATFNALPESFLSSQKTIREITLPENINTIPSSAFYYCQNLTKVNATDIKRIEQSAFNGCTKLTDLDISKVDYIGSSAFNSCSCFAPAALSAGLQNIGSSAFANTAITEITIPEGIRYLDESTFSGCKQLQKVSLPETLMLIKDYVFNGCNLLSEIKIPESVTEIGSCVFQNCDSLKEITIPSNTEKIGSGLFSYCKNLTTVKCKAVVPPVANGTFTSGMDLNHCTLYVAPFTIDAYREATNWSDFYIIKPLNEPVKNIYVNRQMTFDLQSEDNAVLQDNPNMVLDYNTDNNYYSKSNNTVGQLTASGDGTLSAGVFTINNKFYNRGAYINQNNGIYYSDDRRPTLINNAENMRADSVLCIISMEPDEWHFISFQYDVQMSDVYGLNGTDFVIRQYNGAKRAAATEESTDKNNAPMRTIGGGSSSGSGSSQTVESNWEPVPADGVLLAGKGYIIQAANNNSYVQGNYQYNYAATVVFPSRNTVTKNRLFTSSDIIVPLEEHTSEFAHNRSWNLVGNPYPCYYDMNSLKDNFYSPIILWKGSNYQAYSPVDDDIILRPYESFFVQRPVDVEQMVFGVEGRMHYNDALKATSADGQKPGVNYAPAQSINGAQRNVFNFTIEGCGSENRTRIVMNEKATMGYDCARDAAKFFASTPMGAEIYVDADVKYDICERPLGDGTAQLAIRTAKAGEYTIALSGRYSEDWTVMLTDKLTGATVNLNEGAYRFEAEAGTTAGRFMLSFNTSATGIDGVEADIDADAEVSVVNAAGMTVFNGRYADFKAKAATGIYVIVCGDKTYKTVIK